VAPQSSTHALSQFQSPVQQRTAGKQLSQVKQKSQFWSKTLCKVFEKWVLGLEMLLLEHLHWQQENRTNDQSVHPFLPNVKMILGGL
jgi:hypothetical protein